MGEERESSLGEGLALREDRSWGLRVFLEGGTMEFKGVRGE